MIEPSLVTDLYAGSFGALAESIVCGLGFANCNEIGYSLIKIAQIIFADIILSGDNALVIGMAAAGVPAGQRGIAIGIGLAMAAVLRIVFAVIAATLLEIPGILFLGGILLTWVCLRFYKDLRSFNKPKEESADGAVAVKGKRPLLRALITITAADVSMSLDNVLAVAAIARDDISMLVFGLVLAIVLMAFCATIIMKIMTRYPAVSWAGLALLIYLTALLLYDGAIDIAMLLGLA